MTLDIYAREFIMAKYKPEILPVLINCGMAKLIDALDFESSFERSVGLKPTPVALVKSDN